MTAYVKGARGGLARTGVDLAGISLGARSGDAALPWASAIEVSLYVLGADLEPRRHSVYYAAHALAMRLSEGCHAEQSAKAAANGAGGHGTTASCHSASALAGSLLQQQFSTGQAGWAPD